MSALDQRRNKGIKGRTGASLAAHWPALNGRPFITLATLTRNLSSPRTLQTLLYIWLMFTGKLNPNTGIHRHVPEQTGYSGTVMYEQTDLWYGYLAHGPNTEQFI